MDKNLSIQTTANINLSVNNPGLYIPSSNFDIRYQLSNGSKNSDFVIVLYEQRENNSYQYINLNKTSDILETTNFAIYNIYLETSIASSIDFVIMNADNGTRIRIYDLSKLKICYFSHPIQFLYDHLINCLPAILKKS